MAKKKNPAAVELGKLRTKKGPSLAAIGSLGGRRRAENLSKMERENSARTAGEASAKKMSPVERRERAQKAAAARWGKKAE